MAIKALAWMVRVFEPPVYCYHEIVHNRLVVDRFERLGVVFVNDVAEVPPGAFLAQTTLSVDDWAGVRETALRRFPDMWMPGRSDLCFATTNRQAALRAIAHKADAVVVIGSANSSNTVALEKVARAEGASPVLRINSAAELPDDLHGVVGVTAGASAPEELVR